MAALNHPNICSIFEVGWPAGQWFIAMELLEGQTLKQMLASQARAPERWAWPHKQWTFLDFTIQIAEALDIAHAKGIIHRNIKPANVFGTNGRKAKILDFGLANLAMPAASASSADDGQVAATTGHTASIDVEHLTSPGATVSTFAYRSPEQVRGKELDARTDLFSFGAVLYEMTTGRQALSGPGTAAIYTAILRAAPPPPCQVNRELAPELDRIITKALEKDRNLR